MLPRGEGRGDGGKLDKGALQRPQTGLQAAMNKSIGEGTEAHRARTGPEKKMQDSTEELARGATR